MGPSYSLQWIGIVIATSNGHLSFEHIPASSAWEREEKKKENENENEEKEEEKMEEEKKKKQEEEEEEEEKKKMSIRHTNWRLWRGNSNSIISDL